MNATVVYSIFFLSFALCMATVAWLASRSLPGWGWILFVTILFFGNVSIRSNSVATCPDCGKVFKMEIKKCE